MRKFLFIVVACVLSLATNAQRQSSNTISVFISGIQKYNFNNEDAMMIETAALNIIKEVRCFKVLTREASSLHSIIREQNHQVSGDVATEEIRKIGKQEGAQYVLDLNVVAYDSFWNMSVRIMNVETASVVYSTTLQDSYIYTAEDKLGLARRLARKVVQDYKGKSRIER